MTNMGTQFRLTKEESALMDECRKTSFWYRSVPLMAIGTAFMTYRRLNNPTPPRFYGVKLAGSIFAAYLLGKASYIPECRRLILQRLPNSSLANSLESKPYDLISDMAQPPEIVPKSTTTTIFGTRNEEEEQQQDDVFPSSGSIEKNNSRKYVSYDELRQKNRADYATKFPATKPRNDTPPTNLPTPPQTNRQPLPPPILSNEPAALPNPSKRSNVRKNQYGDEVYE